MPIINGRKLYLIVADGAYGISFDIVCLQEPCTKEDAYEILTKEWSEKEKDYHRSSCVITEIDTKNLGIIHTEAPTGG